MVLAISQKASIEEILGWERLTPLQVRIATDLLRFIMEEGVDTGLLIDIHMLSSRRYMERFTPNSRITRFLSDKVGYCSVRYGWKVLHRLEALGYLESCRHGRRRGYRIGLGALKRHRVSANQIERFLQPITETVKN